LYLPRKYKKRSGAKHANNRRKNEWLMYIHFMNQEKLKDTLYRVIFGSTTPAGKAFDVVLFFLIIGSVLVVMLESVSSLDQKYHRLFRVLEWIFTIAFTIEYILRIYCLDKPRKYIFSFYGIVDLLSVLPTYLIFFFVNSQMLATFRVLRLLRIFRVLKLSRYISESNSLWQAVMASRRKISVFLFAVFLITIIAGTLMYLIEGHDNGFTSIPISIYWSIVTLTTVGYGDISPATPLGQIFASIIMILGYGIIAVPTGIVTVEMGKIQTKSTDSACENCGSVGHKANAAFCYSCGEAMSHR
jgi:voltage-gated potassium channel